MSDSVLTENNLDVEEKKVFGRIIDMWSMGSEEDPYAQSTESKVIEYSKTDGLSEEQILKVLKKLEDYKLIHMVRLTAKCILNIMPKLFRLSKSFRKLSMYTAEQNSCRIIIENDVISFQRLKKNSQLLGNS